MSFQHRPSISQRPQHQPKTFKLSVKAIFSLPYRLCNPPPAVGKVRSCTVTPVFKVKLDDVLNRKHLPPLGLKDFEEWLLHVEHCPENLYFALWLMDYTASHQQRATDNRTKLLEQQPSPISYRATTWNESPNCSSLALHYARAKQTFLTPNRESPYALNINADILSPFHTSKLGSPHPDPAVFAEVAVQVNIMLKESLDRMLIAAYTNVGTNRGLCGIAGGTVVVLLGGIPPVSLATRGLCRCANGELSRGDNNKAVWGGVPGRGGDGEAEVDAEGIEELVYGESGFEGASAAFLKRFRREYLEPNLRVELVPR